MFFSNWALISSLYGVCSSFQCPRMLRRPNGGMKKNTTAITLADEETMIHNIKKNFVVNGRNVFKIETDLRVTKQIVFTLNAILRARRASLVFLNICSKPPVVGVVVLLRRRKTI